MAVASAFFTRMLSSSSSILELRQSRVSRLVFPGADFPYQIEINKVLPIAHGLATFRCRPFSGKLQRSTSYISISSANVLGSSSMTPDKDADVVPVPIVMIDQDSDPNATIVQLSFGDRLGALIDTMTAIQNLGLHVTKGSVLTEDSVTQRKFSITKLGRKVENPAMLERVRLTIINNLLKYHPESSERLALGEAFGIKVPKEKLDVDVATHIYVQDDGPKRSLLYIETADRPGLLLEIIKMMADINVNVKSAEIDTEGLVTKDKFHVNYRGAALSGPLSQVLVNSLRYYLRRPETDEDSY